MKRIDKDVEEFSRTWIANPAAKLAFAKLIDRVLVVGAPGNDLLEDRRALHSWIREEKRTARSIGITS